LPDPPVWGLGDSGSRLVEHQYRPCNLSCLHRAERLVDVLETAAAAHHVLETAAAAHHVIEIEAPLPVKVEISGYINMEAVRAHKAAANLLLDIKMSGKKLTLLTGWNRSHERTNATRCETIEALFEHLFVADCFKRIVDAAVAELFDFLGVWSRIVGI
jgi:hypothetical protein